MRQVQRPGSEDELLQVERSGHGGSALFDSFSESYNGSREGSRKGPPAQSSGQGVSSAAVQQRLKSSFASWRDGHVRHAGTHSVHSGTEFYKSQQLQAKTFDAADRLVESSPLLLEGSVSRHRGAQFYAQAAARWKAVAASGSQTLAAELESE